MNEEENIQNRLSFIFSKKVKDQAKLLREARKESGKWKKIKLTREQYKYVYHFFKKHSTLVLGLLVLLFSQGVIESALIVFSRNQLTAGIRVWLAGNVLVLFSILIIAFFLNSFFSIKYEKSLLVLFANRIRRRLFKTYLERPIESLSRESQAESIAKLSYHLPLVTHGVSNTFFGVWRWAVYGGIIVVIGVIGGYHIGNLFLFFLGMSIVLCAGAYFISRFYVSQEVTFYSKIIREVDYNASDIQFVKMFGQETSVVSKFDRLVWFDSYFRIRRDILMKMGYKVVFILLVLISIGIHFFPRHFTLFVGAATADQRLLFIFLLIYFSRALAESVKVGLYIFPARLGIFLTILGTGGAQSLAGTGAILKNNGITFYSHKTRLFRESPYYKNLQFTFNPGERVLFFGDNLSGKTALAKMFSGIAAENPRAVKVIVGEERIEFPGWQNRSGEAYFVDPNFRTERSVLECIMGRVKENISTAEFEKILPILNKYPSIIDLVTHDGNYHTRAKEILENPVRAFALHALYCLVTKPRLIAVDNAWMDPDYPKINTMIQVLDKELGESIILIFSHTKNEHILYTQCYELGKRIKRVL